MNVIYWNSSTQSFFCIDLHSPTNTHPIKECKKYGKCINNDEWIAFDSIYDTHPSARFDENFDPVYIIEKERGVSKTNKHYHHYHNSIDSFLKVYYSNSKSHSPNTSYFSMRKEDEHTKKIHQREIYEPILQSS